MELSGIEDLQRSDSLDSTAFHRGYFLLAYEKKVLMTIDITPAIKMPIIHFMANESVFKTARSILMGLITSSKADFKSSFVTNWSCASAMTLITASTCSCGNPY